MRGPPETVSLCDPDEAPLFSGGGWRPHVYRLCNAELTCSGGGRDCAPGVSSESILVQRGVLRARGPIRPGWLVLGFLPGRGEESFESPDGRMVAALGGADLAVTIAAPGTALLLHFNPTPTLDACFPGSPHAAFGFDSAPLSETGRELMAMARRTPGAVAPSPVEAAEALSSLGCRVAGEIAAALARGGNGGARRRVAREVEALLWAEPGSTGLARVSLDAVANRLNFSRRSVQLALQDEFGLGFVALKRAIRLQQVRAALRRGGDAGIGHIAKHHEFQHLSRFSGQYKKMFGFSPSSEIPGGVAGDRIDLRSTGDLTDARIFLRKMDNDSHDQGC
jgi:AraC-like DNA-binding protein